MKTHATFGLGLIAGAAMLLSIPAMAHGGVQWSVTVGGPGPYYQRPPQVIYPPQYPVYVQPPPVVVYPQQPFAYGPPPAVYSVPPGTYLNPPPVIEYRWQSSPPSHREREWRERQEWRERHGRVDHYGGNPYNGQQWGHQYRR
jgi:hypothetical protein